MRQGVLEVQLAVKCNHDKVQGISLLSASPVGEARLLMPKGMAYKD
jgi:hypothetical protein